ncbi:hypothetical protein M1116_01985 [Patescibacteria group bacterium]|nr:hypothetical protein [Patescibacteria group bacterium]
MEKTVSIKTDNMTLERGMGEKGAVVIFDLNKYWNIRTKELVVPLPLQ